MRPSRRLSRVERVLALLVVTGLGFALPARALTGAQSRQAAQFQMQQNWGGLARLAREGIAADGRDGWAWFYAGLAADGLGHRDEAIKAYETALPLIQGYAQSSAVQMLARDYAALNQADKLQALFAAVSASNPQLAQSLRPQFAAMLPQSPAASLPDVSPRSLAAMTTALRRSWQPDAIPVLVSVAALDNGRGFQTAFDFYSAAAGAGLSVVEVGGRETRLPASAPHWGTIAIPDRFLSLADALGRASGGKLPAPVDHAVLYHRFGDAANPDDLVWAVTLTGADSEVATIPAYVMPQNVLAQLRAKAEAGDAQAEDELAMALATGVAGAPDLSSAAVWLAKSAAQGNLQAENKLGQFYEMGIGVVADPATAAAWYLKAAQGGFAAAQFNLGLLYETGRGVPQDWIRADRWITEAARQGLQPAYAEMTAVRNAAHREQHARQMAAAQRAVRRAGTNCGIGYAPTQFGCTSNAAILTNYQLVHGHPM